MDEQRLCLSDRSLRYGRTMMIISFVACSVLFFQADFEGAALFGIRVHQEQFWVVILILQLWNFAYFLVLINDDIKSYWQTVIATYPLPSLIWKLRKGRIRLDFTEGFRRVRLRETFKDYEFEVLSAQAQEVVETGTIKKAELYQVRRTLIRVAVLEVGLPVLFTVISAALVIQEWLTIVSGG